MNENIVSPPCGNLIGMQIRRLRKTKGWSLSELGRRAGTSAPTLRRYESGWDRFEVATLRRLAAALGARLEIRLVPAKDPAVSPNRMTARQLVRLLLPLFWDRKLSAADLADYPQWVLRRVLMYGDRRQVGISRRWFGDGVLRRAAEHREVDPRTRNFWSVVLEEGQFASEGSES